MLCSRDRALSARNRFLRRAYFYRCPYEARAKFDDQVTSSSSLRSVRRRAPGPGGSRFRSRSAPGSMRLWSLRAHPGDEPAAMSARALPFDGSLPRVIIVASRTAEVSVSSNRRRYILEKRERKQEAECKRERKREAHKASSYRRVELCQDSITRRQIKIRRQRASAKRSRKLPSRLSCEINREEFVNSWLADRVSVDIVL